MLIELIKIIGNVVLLITRQIILAIYRLLNYHPVSEFLINAQFELNSSLEMCNKISERIS